MSRNSVVLGKWRAWHRNLDLICGHLGTFSLRKVSGNKALRLLGGGRFLGMCQVSKHPTEA